MLSGKHVAFPVPVYLYVTAEMVSAAWGTAGASASCINTTLPPTAVIVGTLATFPFNGCDR